MEGRGKRVKKREYFEEKLTVNIPTCLKPMDKELIKQRYPEKERPQILLADKENNRFATFSLLSQKMEASEVKAAISNIAKLIVRLYPSCLLASAQVLQTEKSITGWFAFRRKLDDINIYHFMYVLSVDEKMMLGTCGCPEEDEEGKFMMKQMMESAEYQKKSQPLFEGIMR